jgi:hypothetical protein
MGYEAGGFGNRDIKKFEPCGLQAHNLRLIGNRQRIPRDIERIRSHPRVGELGLHNHTGVTRICDIDPSEVLRRRLMGEPEDAAPISGLLHRYTFSDAPKAIELVVGEETHVVRQGLL